MQSLLVSYAQNREDLILDAFFRDVQNGFYIDVGANHPIKHSVTKLFYKKGWTGIHIEPNASLAAMLRFDRPKDTVLNVGVADKKGTLAFTEYANHGLSTFSDAMREEHRQHSSTFTDTFDEYEVPVRTLSDICKEYAVKHIHFMKVDVEGFEYEVLAGNDWSRYRPEMICIESNHIVHDWRPFLEQQKYTKVFNDGLNDYYLAQESAYRADQFSYAKRLLESGEVITQAVADKITILEKERGLADLRLEHTRVGKVHAEYRADWYERAPLSWMLKKTVRAIDRAVVNRLDKHPVLVASFDASVQVSAGSKLRARELRKLAASYANSAHTVELRAPKLVRIARRIAWKLYRILRSVVCAASRVMRGGAKV